MSQFDVLDPDLALDQKFLIEASAGCGKTFSIEHAYVRLIMEPDYNQSVDKILVLTFTREATSELRARIYAGLEEAKDLLLNQKSSAYPYIKSYYSKPEEELKKCVSNLQEALSSFDSSQIFTIHKFCYLQLKQFLFDAKLSLSQDVETSTVSVKTYESIIRHYLSFNYHSSWMSASQLKLLLNFYKNDLSLLLKACVSLLIKEVPVEKPTSYQEFLLSCSREINLIKEELHIGSTDVSSALIELAAFHKGACNRNGELSQDLKKAIEAFSKIFSNGEPSLALEESILNFSSLNKIFQDSNLKKSALKISRDSRAWRILNYLRKDFFGLLEKASSKSNLLALVSYDCQKLVEAYFENNKVLTPNNILAKLETLIEDKRVCQSISDQYQAVIIDEFQDTDPLQWKILSKIFLDNPKKGRPFYLVGDPKQSIYGFRKADIYTYLKAAKKMGIEDPCQLNTNYRSQPGLIAALNYLFEGKSNSWITLPQLESSLLYKPVQSSEHIEKQDFQDEKRSIHFLLAEQKSRQGSVPSQKLEEEILFPFIASEIIRLHESHNIKLSQFAILVRDRFQSSRLKSFLKRSQIAFTTSRPESLQALDSVAQFLQIFKATLYFKKIRNIHALKVNTLLNWPLETFNQENISWLISYFSELKNLLFEKGFLDFFNSLMKENDYLGNSPYERILAQEEGIYLYQELEQIKELLLQKEVEGCNPYQLMLDLEELSKEEALPEKTYPLRQNFEEEGVQILTLHMSKGLEFDFVFALGLVSQVKVKEELIYDKTNKLLPTTSLPHKDHLTHLMELDAEKLRTLYVALTRAKQRLYIPCVFSPHEPSLGQGSAMDLFLKGLGFDQDSFKTFISEHPEITFCEPASKIEGGKMLLKKAPLLTSPTSLDLKFSKSFKHSFTSLVASTHHETSQIQAPHDFNTLEKSIHTLPAGAHTGSLIHKIMEVIPFSKPFNLAPLIDGTPFEPWHEVLTNLITQILNTRICIQGKSFSLNEICQDLIYKEVEFLYPIKGKLKVEEMELKGGSLNGFIDLVIQHNGLYYLVDYKTNWLGPDNQSYSDLNPAMEEHQYFLQAEIYKRALKKYIEAFEKSSFESCFGGIIYWFVRGIDGPNQGLLAI